MFNTKKFKQAFIEAGKQTAKKKQEVVKRYEEINKLKKARGNETRRPNNKLGIV